MSDFEVFCKFYYNWNHILISPVWLSLLPEANCFSNTTGVLSKWTNKLFLESVMQTFMLSKLLLFCNKCTALWGDRNFLGIETHIHKETLWNTNLCHFCLCCPWWAVKFPEMNPLCSLLGQLVLYVFGGIERKWNIRTSGNLGWTYPTYFFNLSLKYMALLSFWEQRWMQNRYLRKRQIRFLCPHYSTHARL